MGYPRLNVLPTTSQVTDTFRGYNHNVKLRDGEFYDCLNITTKYFPVLATSESYRFFDAYYGGKIQGFIHKETDYYVINGELRDNSVLPPIIEGLTSGEKQIISMGAYICVFPDGAYYNTKVPTDKGFMGQVWEYSAAGGADAHPYTITTCNEDGTDYNVSSQSSTPPVSPTDGTYWIDTGGGSELYELKKWSGADNDWITVSPIWLKFSLADASLQDISLKFREGDYIRLKISGSLNLFTGNEFSISKIGYSSDSGAFITAKSKKAFITTAEQTNGLKMIRRMPIMDYVCECNNRLWGCRYGSQIDNSGTEVENSHVNEIYCCALGDFRNWYKYEGIASDSWAASVGTDGPFTGATAFNGSPLFFKDRCVHQVTISPTGAHRVSDISLYGVEENSSKSLCAVDNTLYYLSDNGVMAYQGGLTENISAAFGDDKYTSGVFVSDGNFLYCAMYNWTQRKNFLMLYDLKRKLWSRKKYFSVDDPTVKYAFTAGENTLLIADYAYQSERILVNETYNEHFPPDEWFCETGIIGYEVTEHKYISRFNIRLQMEQGASVEMYIEYDSSGVWDFAGRASFQSTKSFKFPVRPRRCDHMRLKLQGTGGVKIFSIARELTKGSDHR